MVYTTTFRQINYIASWMKDYIEKAKTPFELKLAKAMKEFISCLEKENILEPGLMMNDKCRKLSIFGSNLENKRKTREVLREVDMALFAFDYDQIDSNLIIHNEVSDSQYKVNSSYGYDLTKLLESGGLHCGEFGENHTGVESVNPVKLNNEFTIGLCLKMNKLVTYSFLCSCRGAMSETGAPGSGLLLVVDSDGDFELILVKNFDISCIFNSIESLEELLESCDGIYDELGIYIGDTIIVEDFTEEKVDLRVRKK
jgi:hypothetical protein